MEREQLERTRGRLMQVVGWFVGVPVFAGVPMLRMHAPTWAWIASAASVWIGAIALLLVLWMIFCERFIAGSAPSPASPECGRSQPHSQGSPGT